MTPFRFPSRLRSLFAGIAVAAATLLPLANEEAQAQNIMSDIPEAQDFGGDWYWVDWMDMFVNAAFYPWLYVDEQSGWFYADGKSSSLNLYSHTAKSWIWTSNGLFPWYVNYSTKDWNEFPAGIAGGGGGGGGGTNNDIKIGVVRANLSFWSNSDQVDIINAMADAGAKRIRLTALYDEEAPDLIRQMKAAKARGMDVSLTIVPTVEPDFMKEGSKPRSGGVVGESAYGLSQVNLNFWEPWVTAFLQEIKDGGGRFDELEIGNEPNWFDFNGDLPASANVITTSSSANAKILAGAQNLGRMYETAKAAAESIFGKSMVVMLGSVTRVPDHWVNQHDGTLVMPNAWLRMVKGNFSGQDGSNYLSGVEAFGVHLYPSVGYNSSESKVKSEVVTYTNNTMNSIASQTGSKPIYVTEIGVSRGLVGSEANRAKVFEWTFEAMAEDTNFNFEAFYLYSWDDSEWAISNNNSPTAAADVLERFTQ